MSAVWYYFLQQRNVMLVLLIINTVGTIYGYYWYGVQLAETPPIFLPFVPDSPTASLFFCVVLFAFLIKKRAPLIEALAVTSLFKYGIWAVGMNIASGFTGFELTFPNYMLIVSHACMAIEGLLYIPFYRIKMWHLVVAGVILLHNDIIDYVFGMMPRYDPLANYQHVIGYLTFWLSVLTIFLVYFLCIKRQSISLKN
ncbi:membrane protein [Pullulanibacillus camelliae]|uniref:Membrane protein n=1 Tax=Pullulanibacillus camelliae TaxID=1707096 RepID=A0A8J2VMM4_9BACL|nr:DUF1405 domain-containing protein [Pullulanibacillus camelliae]GGE38887.1 membrane protein [Pullulanibacillus camelliae]